MKAIDPVLKRRLTGLSVVIIVSSLLIPSLFRGEGQLPAQKITQIPPSIKAPDATQWQDGSSIALEYSAHQLIEAALPIAEEQLDGVQENTFNEAGQVQAWAIQMGSFRNVTNAKKLLSELLDKGYRAYTKSIIMSNGQVLTQVLVGPELTESAIKQLKNSLSSDFNLSIFIVDYKP